MKWSYAINQRIKIALLLLGAFAIIFINNTVEKRNVSALGTSFSSVYEDRLLAESYIYELSDLLHQKNAIIRNWGIFPDHIENKAKIKQNNALINRLIAAYEKTKLTDSESAYFQEVKTNLIFIRKLEEKLFTTGLTPIEIEKIKKITNIHQAELFGNLRRLSHIQVSEGKILNEKAKNIIAGSKLSSQMEIAVLFGLVLFVQALIFTQKSFVPKFPQQPQLN